VDRQEDRLENKQ
jgi:transcription termination factor Rho